MVVRAYGSFAALESLEGPSRRLEPFSLEINFRNNPSMTHPATEEGQHLMQLVRGLESNHFIQRLRLVCGKLQCPNDSEGYDDLAVTATAFHPDHPQSTPSATDALLAHALPCHKSLTKIGFYKCQLSTSALHRFTSSLYQHRPMSLPPLQLLSLEATPLRPQHIQILVQMLQHNPQLLKLELTSCDIGTEGCHTLLLSLGGNTNLQALKLMYNDITQLSLEAVHALNRSNVKRLTLRDETLTTSGVQPLAMGLRSNTCLQELFLSQVGVVVEDAAFVELLQSYNSTLQQVRICGSTSSEIYNWLQRNQRIRTIYTHLQQQQSQALRQGTRLSWPRILTQLHSKPTLVYKMIRHENLEEWIHVTTTATAAAIPTASS